MDINISANNIPVDTKSMYGWIKYWSETKGDDTAVVIVEKNGEETSVSWSKLLELTDKTACFFASKGIKEASKIIIALPNAVSTIVTALAAWHLGACVFFLSYELPEKEFSVLLDQIAPDMIAASGRHGDYLTVDMSDELIASLPAADREFPDISLIPARATATGGSTGTPKIIIEHVPMSFGQIDFYAWGMLTGQHAGQTQLICGSLHHSLFGNSFYIALAMGNKLVVMRQFSDVQFLRLVEKHKVNCFVLVPTMMSRIIRSPECAKTDLSSVECMHHAGASCPVWLKKDWIKMLGGEKIHEFYSMSEKIGTATVRGDEWLAHEGTVGRPFGCEIEILNDEFEPVPNGTVGTVWFKSDKEPSTHYLLGTQRISHAPDGALSVGDLGYMDDDGFLYIVDRRSDMIISGGKNVYAAEVENILREYAQVADVLVIGLPDVTWGRRVHAIIEPSCSVDEFKLYTFADFCFRRISNYKLPKTVEFVERIPRDLSGKVNKRKLAEARENAGENSDEFKYVNFPNGHQIYAWRKKKSTKK